MADELKPGAVFSTEFESGCVVVDPPNDLGHFIAIDSEGVLCDFAVSMVVDVLPASTDGSDLLFKVACESCGRTPELLDEDLTCADCRAETREKGA